MTNVYFCMQQKLQLNVSIRVTYDFIQQDNGNVAPFLFLFAVGNPANTLKYSMLSKKWLLVNYTNRLKHVRNSRMVL